MRSVDPGLHFQFGILSCNTAQKNDCTILTVNNQNDLNSLGSDQLIIRGRVGFYRSTRLFFHDKVEVKLFFLQFDLSYMVV